MKQFVVCSAAWCGNYADVTEEKLPQRLDELSSRKDRKFIPYNNLIVSQLKVRLQTANISLEQTLETQPLK